MLSIVMPCFNDNQVLGRAVQSALRQNVEKEIIVVDDGSEIPVTNLWGDPVRVIRHDRNRGLSAALNTGVSEAKYDRFVILSSDDMFDQNFAVNLMQHKADIISCDFRGETGKIVKCRGGSLELLKSSNCHSYAAIVKKELWQRVGGFKTYMNPSWEDWEFFLNCAKHGATWHHVPQPLHLYFRNPKGRDAQAQTKEYLLKAKLEGAHNDIFGQGRGLVTFIIPCYDQEQFLLEAVNSVFDQIYPHVNCIVVDDGSPGDVISALDNCMYLDRITVVRQKNRHLSGARNTGIQVAIEKFNSQFLVMLDSDDKVHAEFIEKTLGIFEPQKYVYSDIHLFGDAWHVYKLPEFSCETLTRRHLHPCTFLAESQMFKDVKKRRGYIYDENMKSGYEDWEVALAFVETGYCGRKVAEPLFYYRNHQNGSMRTEADKVNDQLTSYIKSRHPWVSSKEKVRMACTKCGGRYSTRVVYHQNGVHKMFVTVPGLGEVDSREALEVNYTGTRTDTMTKIGKGIPGQGNAIYRYSAVKRPTFTIVAGDAHLFVGPFKFSKIKQEVQEVQQTARKEKIEDPLVERVKQQMEVVTKEQDDLTALVHVGPAGEKKLNEAGLSFFKDVARANPEELALVLGVKENRAKEVIKDAKSK